MENTIKSYLYSFLVILVFYYATRGIVRLFWNHSNNEVVKARTFILFVSLFFGSLFYIIVTYHLAGGKTEYVQIFYKIYLFLSFIYIVLGLIYDIISGAKMKQMNHTTTKS